MTADSTASVEVPATGTYRVDPQQSTASYSGRHIFGLGVVHATFAINSGELRVADPPTASTIVVSLDANSFSSNNARRDRDVRSPALLDVAATRTSPSPPTASVRTVTAGWLPAP